MPAESFGAELKKARSECGLTQQQLANRGGLSLDAVQSYEQGRRWPREQELELLRAGLRAKPETWDRIRAALGLEPGPRGIAVTLAKFRPAPESAWDEVQDCAWVSLVTNERKEIVAWNRLANAVSEMDLGSLTPGTGRSILRMAATEHYAEHLTNWPELIGRLVSLLKREGGDITAGAPPPYLQAVLDDIATRDPRFLPELFGLWVSAPPWESAKRNIHPVEWRLGTGQKLRFHGLFGEWSDYDGLFSFDWHAADGPTADWVAARASELGPPPQLPPLPNGTLAEELTAARLDVRLSRAGLARNAGVSASAVVAYETGDRRPSRGALLAIGRALTLDGYRINRLLRIAGHAEEASDFARWLSGETPMSIYRGMLPAARASLPGLARECDSFDFPCILLDQRCHAIHGNRQAEHLFGLTKYAALPGRPAPHLLQAMVSPRFRERVGNWRDVVSTVIPGSIEPHLMDGQGKTSAEGVRAVAQHLRKTDPTGLAMLLDIWEQSPGVSSHRRVATPFDWLADDGTRLRFHCVFTNWNSLDPYKAMDLFPADSVTFDWLAMS